MRVPVRVYERAERLTPMARTLIVTAELSRVLGFRPESAVVNTVHTLELRANGSGLPIALREPDLVVERADLIRLLARKAEAAGAKLLFGQSFVGLEIERKRSVVHFRRRGADRTERVVARAVIGADGVRSQVARSLGRDEQPTVTVLQARVSLPPGADSGAARVWFVPDDTPYFYWLCPESPGSAALGIVDASSRDARGKLDRFMRERSMHAMAYQAALIPLYRPGAVGTRRAGPSNAFLVGDAAGQVKVTTVGGTVTGLLGARAAARAISHGSEYTRELRCLDRELRLHWRLRSLMSRFHEHEYDTLLRLMRGKVGSLLEIHNRDRLAHAIWSIVAAEPKLPLLAARAFLRA
jgi:flavin-dependent dehydrogenase